MSGERDEDRRIAEAVAELRRKKRELGEAYWQDGEVIALQQTLRRMIGEYGAWGENKLPMHQRARAAARFESESADLLWPGRASGG
jgi:glycerol-3-phosphate O-acyltransferase